MGGYESGGDQDGGERLRGRDQRARGGRRRRRGRAIKWQSILGSGGRIYSEDGGCAVVGRSIGQRMVALGVGSRRGEAANQSASLNAFFVGN